MQGAQRPPIKKEASYFINKKCTLKNTKGSKTSNEKKRHCVSQIRNTPLKI
jgi:hypothetical protein